MGHKNDGDTSRNWSTRHSHQRISTENGGLGNKRTSRDHIKYIFIKNTQNTEKSP